MTDRIQSDADERASQTGPGQLLREARESRTLTVEQVAAQLRMQVRIIEALENDDYSALSGTTFVQGYLRSYSRLLGLSGEKILALAPFDGIKEPQLVSYIAQGESEASSRDLPFRLVNLLILLVVIVGVGWWFSQRELTIGVSPQEEAQVGVEQGLLLPEENVGVADGVVTENGQSGGDVVDTSATKVEAVQKKEETIAVVKAEKKSVATATPVAPPALTVDMPKSKIELEYQADSWTEIRDAAGRELAYEMIPAGKNLKLQGEAPFKVFLGYAPGVTVYYNGDLYDHSPYQRGDVVRFSIGRADQNRPGIR